MSSTAFIVERYVCPTIGAILSNLAFAAPIKSLQAAVKAGKLAGLNPTPWAFMLGNTVGWLAYSFITGDLFVFFANVFGVLISIYLNIGAMKLQYYEEVRKASSSIQLIDNKGREKNTQQDDSEEDGNQAAADGTQENNTNKRNQDLRSFTSHEIKVLCIVVIWILILSMTSLTSTSKDRMENVVGIAVNINLALFYGAPLSTISTVFRTKTSSSIHFWTMIMNTSNAFFWCVYAFAVVDYYILIPNGIGFTFGIVQAVLYSTFPHDNADISVDGAQQFLGNGDEREPESQII
ncbi:hypothetical protein HJC23_007094 [Cyclotella cryptica]|uniref:Sugar transporter SWEET1 n=1 Tax=Cyclotella cryptica TaxID=29204 RepID=A0ABD3P203_9STRA|eukprot:CCRYP_018358-RA/>CCRYP_018358-RA protein AED:0.03 eAED:0.03 QI:382/1/1/1/1/1/2/66/292